MQIAVIGTTWLADYWIYIQFRPLVNMIKLYIEMCNAELIGHIAQASAYIRHSGQPWCDTTNPAVEPISLNATRLGLDTSRPEGRDQSNGNGHRRPSIFRNTSG